MSASGVRFPVHVERHDQPESRAAAFAAFYLDVAAQAPGENQGSGQTETVAVARQRGADLHLGVAPEDGLMMFRCNAGAVIADVDAQGVLILSDLDFEAFFAVVEGVFYQIGDNLTKLDFILQDFGAGDLGVNFEDDALAAQKRQHVGSRSNSRVPSKTSAAFISKACSSTS